jgi:hypothetical protein
MDMIVIICEMLYKSFIVLLKTGIGIVLCGAS